MLDYTLLRNLDFDTLKHGDNIIWKSNGSVAKYLAGPDSRGMIAIKWILDDIIDAHHITYFGLCPIAWVENLPVYINDTLYNKLTGEEFKVLYKNPFTGLYTDGLSYLDSHSFTWKKPTVKKSGWIAIYEHEYDECGILAGTTHVYPTKEEAESMLSNRKELVVIEVHWEE